MKIYGALKLKSKSLFVPEWCCAIRFNKHAGMSLLNDTETKFCVIKNPLRYWTADPFLINHNGKYYLFFEAYDRLKRKGLLGYREITEQKFGKINIIYETDSHLSYPYIYEEKGSFYIIPESKESGKLIKLKCVDFPCKWELDSIIAKIALVDTTPFKFHDEQYFISERVMQTGRFNRVDLFYEENGKFVECKNNPVKNDVINARGAGKIFEYNGSYIRPAQNCGKFYGESINFNKIIAISKDHYNEELIKSISVSDLKLDSNRKYIGIHTYNKLDNIEVIDLKIAKKFNLLNIIGALTKRLKGLR